MKTIIFLLCLFFGVGAANASIDAPVGFVYDAHKKIDPFWPLVSANGVILTYDNNVTATDIVLQGVVIDSSGDKNIAIINGKVVKIGDKVGVYTIESIANDHVNIINDQEQMMIKLKKGGV